MWNQILGHLGLKMLAAFFIGLTLNDSPLGASPFPRFFWNLIKYGSYPKILTLISFLCLFVLSLLFQAENF